MDTPELRFVDAWSVPLGLPYEIGCNCDVDTEDESGDEGCAIPLDAQTPTRDSS
jgi:hypothetical protein